MESCELGKHSKGKKEGERETEEVAMVAKIRFGAKLRVFRVSGVDVVNVDIEEEDSVYKGGLHNYVDN